MGCDIHAHIEVKIKGDWYYYDELDISRNYDLFSKMANVRNREEQPITPISELKGLPNDLTFMTKFKSDIWDMDGHSHSWLSSREVFELEEWIEKNVILERHRPIGYLFGNGLGGWTKFPEDFDKLKSMGLQDFRLVFWFDN